MDAAVWTVHSYDFASWALLPLAVALVILLLGAAGLLIGRSSSENIASNLFLIAAAIWAGATGLVVASVDPDAAAFWTRPLVLGAITMIPLALRSAESVVPHEPMPRGLKLVLWLMWFGFAFVGLQGDALVDGLHEHWFGYYPRWGTFGPLVLAYCLAGWFLVLRSYSRELRFAPPASARRKRSMFLMISNCVAVLAYLDFLPGWGVPVPPVAFAAMAGLTVMAVLAQARYNVLDLAPMASSNEVLARMEDPLLVVTRHGEVGYANPAAGRIFGFERAAMVGRTVEEVTEDRVKTEQVRAVLDRGAEVPEDIVLAEDTGFPRYLSISTAPMPDTTGRPFAAVLAFRDHTIREKYRAELELHRLELEKTVARRTDELSQTVERLQREMRERENAERGRDESEARFHELADLLPEAVYETDIRGQVTFVNRRGFEATGYGPGDLERGFLGSEILVPEEREAAREQFRQRLRGEGDVVREHTVLRKDGSTFPALLRSMPLMRDGKAVGMRGLLIDISQRKELELQLRQSQRLEAIGQLAGGVAHDFNNLLTVILGTSFFLRKALPQEGRSPGDLETLERAAHRASDLTRQLLAFSRKQVLARRQVDLNLVVREIQSMLDRLIGEDITIELALEPDLAPLRVDRAQIEQVLMNLAVNARDAMPRGGTLWITTQRVELPAEQLLQLVEPREMPPGLYARVTVRDSGGGMTEEVRHRAFEPFFTTKGRETGTGLGLSTVYGIVRQHGGAVTIDSRPGEGTTFSVYLPLDPKPPERDDATATPVADLTGSETVLVVEDDDVVRDVVVRHLVQHGYEVHAAADAEAALAEGPDALRAVDLLLTDVVMPGMDGRSLAERVLEANPGVRVLFMSGYTDDRLQTHRVHGDEVRLLTKPFTQEELVREVRDVLETAPAASRTL